MNSQMLQWLQSADDPECCEYPAGFDQRAAMERVEQVVSDLESLLGVPLDLDTAVQDASFFTEIALHRPAADARCIDVVLGVRFSAFGDLFTIWSSCAFGHLSPTVVQEVISAVGRQGFRYVDEASLAEPYTGANPAFSGSTWGYRFFEYL